VSDDRYDELRTAFTAAVSHELRTPLARILALLESAQLPGADQAALIEQARVEVDETRQLVDDVLFLSELETGREVVSLGDTEVEPVVADVIHRAEERAARADVALRTEVEDGIRLPLRPRMLRMIAENLVDNALRHAGPRARFTLSVRRAGGRVVLRAIDNGVGVDADELGRLFERFYRGDRARTSRGTGLGLAIVKHVVTAAGGTVEALGPESGGLEIRATFG
jgi:two-component system phosphate regulon sensor histidine kinase PhoR